MNHNLLMSEKSLASITLYTITAGHDARTDISPCLEGAKALVRQGLFCSSLIPFLSFRRPKGGRISVTKRSLGKWMLPRLFASLGVTDSLGDTIQKS